MYVEQFMNKKGKEMFEGEEVSTIIVEKGYGYQRYNLVGDYSSLKIGERYLIYSAKTQVPLFYGIIENIKHKVDNSTLHNFLVIKNGD